MIGRRAVAVVLGTVAVVAGACGGTRPTARQDRPPSRAPSETTAPASPTPAVDTAATPAGWVAVDDGDAQLSVPADWFVTVDGCVAPQAPGTIVLARPGATANPPGRVPSGCAPTQTATTATAVVAVGPIATSVPADAPPPLTVNGIVVDVAGATSCTAFGPCPTWYVVRSLGVEITVDAVPSQNTAVLGTLTRSPRAVVFAPGRSSAVPVGWHRVRFGGISAAVPSSWPVQQTTNWGSGCGGFGGVLDETQVTLNTGATDIEPSCPAEGPGGQRVQPPRDGLVIDPGRYGPLYPGTTFGSCRPIHGLRVCPTTSDDDGILVVAVHLQATGPPVAVEIGLGGGGLEARTILDSLRAA